MTDLAISNVAVIGGGPAGLMAAEVISAAGVRVTVYERMPSVGRKFLMAGRGGLNLTHSDELPEFLAHYGAQTPHLRSAIEALSPTDARAWCEALGQPTFVGSSGRVFPTAMKASPLLRAWLRRLGERGVQLRARHDWRGWDDAGHLSFATPDGQTSVPVDAAVLALGGASWPNLGSNGAWADVLRAAGVPVAPLLPSNCGFRVAWSAIFRDRFQGEPLKRVAVRHADETARGEAIVTSDGIEGGAIYALSPGLRRAIAANGTAPLEIDLRPDIEATSLTRQLEAPRRKQSMSAFLRKAGKLSPVAIGLLQEAAHRQGRQLVALPPGELAALVKAVPVELTATASIARAISSAGGIAWEALDPSYMLLQRPGTFAAGEMLDWEAPTGGYLLQACLSTGAAAGRGVVKWLATR